MNDLERLKNLLDSGALLHPASDALSIVDFANALHSLMGVPGVELNGKAASIRELIGEPEHLALVMADGFGMNFVEGLKEDAFIRSHVAEEMRTVFPSTTPIALTTLATGEWPGRHAVIGWFLYLREIEAVSTIISFMRTKDKKSLSKLGMGISDAYPLPSRMGMANRESLHIMPSYIVRSAYSSYWSGDGSSQIGYDVEKPQDAVEMAICRIRGADRPTCVYIYMPQVDSAAHVLGASHPDTLKMAERVDGLLESLAEALPANARLAMTADHGHLDVPERKTYALDASDEIVRLCNGALTGDQRAVYAGVADENLGDFRRLVHERFGDDFLVLTAREVQEVGLLGNDALSEETISRLGSALVLATGGAALDYRAALGESNFPIVSHHGGLTPAEMRIPLVVA